MISGALLFIAVLLLWSLAGAAALAWGARTARPGSRRLVRRCGRRVVRVEDEFTVELWPSATDLTPQPHRPPQRVVLVLDHSGSMGTGPGSPLERLRSIARTYLLTRVAEPCRAAVVAFDDSAQTTAGWTPDPELAAAGVERFKGGGGTQIQAGLEEALRLIESEPGEGRQEAVILFTDGGGRRQPAERAANRLKQLGVRLVTVGLGHSVDHHLLARIASSPEDHHQALERRDVEAIYDLIGAGLRGRLQESFSRGAFLYAGAGRVAPLQGAGRQGSSGELEWVLPEVHGTPRQPSTYRLRAERVGWHRIAAAPARLHLTGPGGEVFDATSDLAPRILVLPRFGWPLTLALLNPLFWLLARGRRIDEETLALEAPSLPAPLSLPPRRPLPAQTPLPDPDLAPAFIVGLGYTGGLVLGALGELLADLAPAATAGVRTLWLDTGPLPEESSWGSRLGAVPGPEDRLLLPHNVEGLIRGLAKPGGQELASDEFRWLDAEAALARLRSRDFDLSRGTGGQRLLGRAVLRQDLLRAVPPLTAALLERLESLPAGYRIVIIAGMAGGTGSGWLADLLVHLQGLFRSGASPPRAVDVMLLPPRAVRDPSAPAGGEAANLVAFAQELARITMPGGPLLPAVPAGSGPPLSRSLDQILVLEDPLEDALSTSSDAVPWSAAMVLMQLLYAPQAGLDRLLEELRPALRRKAKEQAAAMVFGVGATWRWLPIRQIREWLAAKVVWEVLAADIAGQDPQIDPGLASPERTPGAVLLARDLLSGRRCRRPSPIAMVDLEVLAARDTASSAAGPLLQSLKFLPGSQIPISTATQPLAADSLNLQQTVFENWLNEGCLSVLNESIGALKQLRGSVEIFWNWVEGATENVSGLESTAVQAGYGSEHRYLVLLLGRYRQSVSSLRRQVDAWWKCLAPPLGNIPGEEESGAAALASHALNAAEEALERLVRRLDPFTLWSPEIRQGVLERYEVPARRALGDHIAWHVQDGGRWTLSLGDLPVLADPQDPSEVLDTFKAAALALGVSAVCQEDIAAFLDLEEWLELGQRRDPVRVVEARQAEQAAAPVDRREVWVGSRGENSKPVGRGTDLIHAVGGTGHLVSISRLMSPCALLALQPVESALKMLDTVPHRDLPWLDIADRSAAVAEDGIARIGLPATFLSPPLRAGFVRPERVRAFTLGIALDLMEIREPGFSFVLAGIPLVDGKEGSLDGLLLQALDVFLHRMEDDRVAGVEGLVDERLAALPDSELSKLRRSELLPSGQEVLSPPALRRDLERLTALYLQQEIDRRLRQTDRR